MKSTCVQHPAKEPMILVRQWQLEFCNGNIAAAALMSFFEYWHNIKLEQQSRNKRIVKITQDDGDVAEKDISLYQFHKHEHLVEGILKIAKGKVRINEAIEFLIKRGVISVHSNPNPRFKFDNTRHFLFHPEVCNDFLKNRAGDEEDPRRSKSNDDRSKSNDDRSKSNDDGSESNGQVQRLPSEITSEITSETSSIDDPSSLEEVQSAHLNNKNGHGPIKVTIEHLRKIYHDKVGSKKLEKHARWLADTSVDLVTLLAFAGWFKEKNGHLPDPRPQPAQVEENWLYFQDDINADGGNADSRAARLREYIWLHRNQTDLIDVAGNVIVDSEIVWRNPDYHEGAEIEQQFAKGVAVLLRGAEHNVS